MGRRRNRNKGRFRHHNSAEQLPKGLKEKKAVEVRSKLNHLGLDQTEEQIKRLLVILDLWVSHNRSHQETIELPSIPDYHLDIKLFSQPTRESKIALKYQPPTILSN